MRKIRALRCSAVTFAWVVFSVLPVASRVCAQTQLQEQTPLTTQSQPQVQAQPQPRHEAAVQLPATHIGDSTIAWLAIQRDGRLAAPAQPMLGAEADAAYRRYLKSFDHPIPEHLDSSVGTVGGGSSGSGGTGAQY